jgi:tRNA pseudouridine38-40 synthase
MQYSDKSRRLAFVLEYDGTGYKGFQWQPHAPSVQGEVERAIRDFTGETTRVRGASRTDAGAHAKGQVVDFLTQAPYTTETFIRALNWHLPLDIKIRGAYDIPMSFNSRKDAVSRVYRYSLLNSPWPSPLLRGFSHRVSTPLDVDRMKEAAGHLLGVHDFSPFTNRLPPGKSAVRRVDRWDIWQEDDLVFIEAEANGFLLHQIRRTNGILAEVGVGKHSTGVIKGLIDGTLGGLKAPPSLPAKGLCLMRVNYPRPFCAKVNDGNETK